MIATLARRAEERGLDVFIVTADKDARQLISDHVRILNLRKNKFIDAAELEKEWGIRPDQVVDFLALTGDSVDNVPGVPGIGEGFAATFLKEFGTLDQLLANVRQVKGPKKQQSLREHAETARLARRWSRLRDDLPLALDWDALKTQAPDVEPLSRPCAPNAASIGSATSSRPSRCEPLRAEQISWAGRVPHRRHARGVRQRSSPSSSGSPGSASTPRRPRIDPLRADLVGHLVQLAGPARPITCRCAGRPDRGVLDQEPTLEALRPILRDPAVEKVGQNIKYDMLALERAGVELAGPITDTMILSYLLESGERNHNLDQLSQRLLDHTMIPITDLIGKGKNQATHGRGRRSTGSPSTPARMPTRPGGSSRFWRRRCAQKGSGRCMPSWSGR